MKLIQVYVASLVLILGGFGLGYRTGWRAGKEQAVEWRTVPLKVIHKEATRNAATDDVWIIHCNCGFSYGGDCLETFETTGAVAELTHDKKSITALLIGR